MPQPEISARINVGKRILLVRGERVLVDADLAQLYGVSTKRLNEQVKRNGRRFPADFAFRLTKTEKAEVVANCDHLANLKFSPVLPRVFTEHGAVMAANVLQSDDAIEMSVFVVRAFVRLRQALLAHVGLAQRLDERERRLSGHDQHIEVLVAEIRKLLTTNPSVPPKRRIGFRIEDS